MTLTTDCFRDIRNFAAAIEPADPSFAKTAQARLDNLTKPRGSLGALETLICRIAAMKRETAPVIRRKVMFTLAGDHGVVEEGVSAYPREVTLHMIHNFIRGGAAINVFTRRAGAEIIIADLGVAADLSIDHPSFRDKKTARGTANFTRGPAMTREQAARAVMAGIELFNEEYDRAPIDLAGTGEMGIGNTTAASAMLAAATGEAPERVTGRGAGLDDAGVSRKITAIRAALAINQPDGTDGLDILHKVGGFEIAGLTGVMLAAARRRVPVLTDGFIAGSAALAAFLINPLAAEFMLAAHLSDEPGHGRILQMLGLEPVLRLGMRLGEGTGAALAMMVIGAATAVMTEMADFESAGVPDKLP